jgi:hypothetical protein
MAIRSERPHPMTPRVPDPRELARIAGTAAGCRNARRNGRDDWNADDRRIAEVTERRTLDALSKGTQDNE